MKKKTMHEMNEQFKNCPVRRNEYEINGMKFIVTSHFTGTKILEDVLYKIAFDNAFNEVVNANSSAE